MNTVLSEEITTNLTRWRKWSPHPTTRHAVIFALFLALAVLWLRPLPWQMGDHVTGPGDPLTTAWRLAWPAEWLLHRDAPFWETNILYPASNTFARDELTLGESLIAGPIYVTTHNTLVAYNLTLLLTMALCGFTTYCLAWHFLRNRTAGIIAGMIVTLAPYHLAQLDHAGLLAVQWLPLVILFLDRTIRYRRWRDALFLGLATFLQATSAGYYAYWSGIIIALYLGYVLLCHWPRWSLGAMARVGVGLAVAFVALIPVVVPFMRVAGHEGFARPQREVEYWSARPQTWLAATPNNLLYGSLVRAHAWTWSTEMYLFPGIVALLLAMVGIGARRRNVRWFALALTVCGGVLTFGPLLHLARRDTGHLPLPYMLLSQFVPGGDALRAPVRAAPIAMLGFALLAAFGWQHLAAQMRHRGVRRRTGAIVAILVCLALGLEYGIAPLQTVRVPQLDARESSLVGWLQHEPASVVAVLPDLRTPVTMALATTNRHRFINGDAEILPPATRALFDTLADFPSPRSIAALEAIGVTLIVLERSGYADSAWEGISERIRATAPEVVPVATLPDALVFHIAPESGPFPSLHDAIPASATVFISGGAVDDRTALERALAAHILRDHTVRGRLTTGWVSDPAPPAPGEAFDYAVFAVSEPVPPRYDTTTPVWTDGVLVVYRAQSGSG